jgi:hypothetical protein
MDKAKPSSQVNSLLSAIQRTPIVGASSSAPPVTEGKGRRVGKPVQFWMHEEDRKLIRELAAWLASQGIRSSDSLVLCAALHMAVPGPGLLAAYRKVAQYDGRLKQNQPPVAT